MPFGEAGLFLLTPSNLQLTQQKFQWERDKITVQRPTSQRLPLLSAVHPPIAHMRPQAPKEDRCRAAFYDSSAVGRNVFLAVKSVTQLFSGFFCTDELRVSCEAEQQLPGTETPADHETSLASAFVGQ